MQIRDILQEKGTGAVTIEADRNLHEAIERLNKHSIGDVINAHLKDKEFENRSLRDYIQGPVR